MKAFVAAVAATLLIAVGIAGTLGYQALTDDDDRCQFLKTGYESRARIATPPANPAELHDAQVRQEFLDSLVAELCS